MWNTPRIFPANGSQFYNPWYSVWNFHVIFLPRGKNVWKLLGDSYRYDTPQPIAEKFVTDDSSATPTSVSNLVHIRPPWGLLHKWVKYDDFLFIPFFWNSPTGQTRWQIFAFAASNDANSVGFNGVSHRRRSPWGTEARVSLESRARGHAIERACPEFLPSNVARPMLWPKLLY